MMETRAEHIEWCKVRAREYLALGDIQNAIASLLSDMSKREDTRVNPYLAMAGLNAVLSNSMADAKRFIEGF